jgi:AcrR family transcriptional regulator
MCEDAAMPGRKYEQGLRADRAAETRRRILDAVATQLRQTPTQPVSLDKVAELAQVSRSTIYVIFGSRAGLFDAFTVDLWERTGAGDLTRAVAAPDALDHLRGGLRAASRMYAADRDIYRVLYTMARLEPGSVGGAVAKMEAERRGGMAHLVNRLAEDGVLRDDVTAEFANDLLWMLCSFDALDRLITDRGMPVDEAADLLALTAERALCR